MPAVRCRNAKWRERRGRVDKDVRRTDRQQPFYSESRSSNIKQLRNILLTYVQYNNDLGYCQVSCLPDVLVHNTMREVTSICITHGVSFAAACDKALHAFCSVLHPNPILLADV